MFVFFFLKPFFRLFLSLLRDFRITRKVIYRLEVLGFWLRLLNFRVLHSNTLSLYFGYDNISRTIVLLSLIVHLSDIKSRLKACFGLNLNHFLDYFYLGVKFLTFLFYLGLYRGFKAFSEEFNKVELF